MYREEREALAHWMAAAGAVAPGPSSRLEEVWSAAAPVVRSEQVQAPVDSRRGRDRGRQGWRGSSDHLQASSWTGDHSPAHIYTRNFGLQRGVTRAKWVETIHAVLDRPTIGQLVDAQRSSQDSMTLKGC